MNPPPVAPPRLRLDGVAVARGGVRVVEDVSFAVAGATLVAIVGASGSGKTSLLKAINRLLPLAAGRVELDGADAAPMATPALRRRIGYALQEIGLFPHMDVAANISVALRLAGSPPETRRGRVAELLDLVGLPQDFAGRMPDALSGGQAQRVGIARALATGPSLVLMDEPFGALDPPTRAALGESYRALGRRLGVTTLMVTHDMTEALLLADRVLAMDRGRLVADETPAALLAGGGGDAVQALLAPTRAQADRLAELAAER